MTKRKDPPVEEEIIEWAGPSKSQRKREMLDLQELGEKLSRLRPDQVRELPLGERLIEALLAAQKMEPREPRRRQMHFVGKLMRGEDADAIADAYERTKATSEHAQNTLNELEQWRARLLAEGDAAIGDTLKAFPGVESTQLRQLIRDARREQERGKPPAASRKLFQYLKSHKPAAQE